MKEISFIRTQTPDINRVHKSAFESIVIISATIFLCEILVMAIIYILPIRFPWIESFWDATLLLILLSPVVYFYIYNPSHQALQKRIEYQKALEENQLINFETKFNHKEGYAFNGLLSAKIIDLLRSFSTEIEQLSKCSPVGIVVMDEIGNKKKSERKLLIHQKKLRELTTELLSAQEQERKKLAAELHDPGSAALRKGLYPR